VHNGNEKIRKYMDLKYTFEQNELECNEFIDKMQKVIWRIV